jgi:hypothetical protein
MRGVSIESRPLISMNERKRLIFLVGNSRSGTTMLGRALGLHSQVFTFEELHFFEQIWSASDINGSVDPGVAANLIARLLSHQRCGILNGPEWRDFISEAESTIAGHVGTHTIAQVFQAFLEYETKRMGKSVPCDQTPRNVYYIGDILRLYPDARVVIMVRDPRDVLASQKRKWKMRFLGFNRDPVLEALRLKVNYHPVTTSLLWNAAVRAGDRYAHHERVCTVRFEDVLQNPSQEIQRICSFLDLSFESCMLAVPHVNSSYEAPDEKRRGITKTPIGRWRDGALSATEVYICQRLTADCMKRHGYEPSEVRPGLLRIGASLTTLPAKAALALVLNAGKVRSIPQAFRRRFASPAAPVQQ